MARLSQQALYALAQKHFGDLGPGAVETAVRIAQAESGGDYAAVGDNYRSGHQSANSRARYDRGLMQINSQHPYDPGRLVSDPDYNMRAAREIFNRQGFQAWATYPQVARQMGGGIAVGSGMIGGMDMPDIIRRMSGELGGANVPPEEIERIIGEMIQSTAFNQALALGDQAIGIGGLTGYYGGAPTLARDQMNQQQQQFLKSLGLDVGQLTGYYGGQPTLAREQADRGYGLDVAGLTGQFGGQPTLAARGLEQQGALANREMDIAERQFAQRFGLDALNSARQFGLNIAELTGRIGDQNTLARDQFEQSIREADRQYATDLGRFGLQVADHNFQQRMAVAQNDLQRLSLAASLRGPENALAYNFALNEMAPPPGRDVDITSGMSPADIYEPLDWEQLMDSAWDRAGMQPAGAQPAPQQQAPAPQPKPQPKSAPKPAAPEAFVGDPKDSAMANALNNQRISGQISREAFRDPPQPVRTARRNELDRYYQSSSGSQVADNPILKRYAEQASGFAAGGATDGEAIMLGDDESGRETGHEELLLNPTNAPVFVIPNDMLDEIMRGGVERAATGGAFGSFQAFDQDAIGQLPVVQKLLGNQPAKRFGGTGFDMTLPETDITLPEAHRTNVRTLQDLAPSETALLSSIIESPRFQGGLGLDFGDYLNAAMRAAPRGRNYAPAAYGR